ncbi:MutS-related protein [Cohnella nanjingensis]|nr:hypothetical protein [Cohnella nanjingensis]
MREIDHGGLFEAFAAFSEKMRKVREYETYSRTFEDPDQRMKWLLDAANLYSLSVRELQRILTSADLQSQGLARFYNWLTDFIHAPYFAALSKEATELHREFSRIRFDITFEDGTMTISPADGEQDYCQALSAAFRQEQTAANPFSFRLFPGLHLSDMERSMLKAIKKRFPLPFRKLDAFYAEHSPFIEPSLLVFEREVQFYLACLRYFHSLQRNGLSYAYPEISGKRELRIQGGYDLSLATSARHSGATVVGNSFDLEDHERILVLTGPNQGGKTTFARSFGQMLHLSAIGCPVPCRQAVLFEFDRIFTHFPSREQPGHRSGKLQDELDRLKPILNHATDRSVILFNELFCTTSTHDAYAMGSQVLLDLLEVGATCLYVTHIFELAASHDKFVSLVAATDPEDLSRRTFRIRRQQADGLVHASSLVRKYGLTRHQLKERIQR